MRQRYITVVMFVLCLDVSLGKYYPYCFESTVADCQLPDCYCKYEDIPGNISSKHTPQMVLFTYTGALTKKVRDRLYELFPSKIKNPDGCSVGITIFVVSQGTDYCGLHKLYVRGHEVALAGKNRTYSVSTWGQEKWGEAITGQQFLLSEKSNIDIADMVGMRAQRLRPGGDDQFRMLAGDDYQYDSSLVAGPSSENGFNDPYLWPFTLDRTLKQHDILCKNRECPKEAYPSLWEVPVSPLVGTRNGKPRLCSYLDDCLSDFKKAADVTTLLKRHFQHSYDIKTGNRAPLQINLQARTLASDMAVQGLHDFIKYVTSMDDTWMVTTQDMLNWVRSPTPMPSLRKQNFFECPEREYIKCTEEDGKNKTVTSVTFSELINVDEIWIWQTAVFVALYIIFYKYDRHVAAKKKAS